VPQGLQEQAESVTSKFASPPSLPEWLQQELPYQRRTFQNDGNKIHFIDEGTGPDVLLQHGNPTWCFLWRKVIRILLKQNVRVVAPDLVGLGLSDKPRDVKVHTLSFHADRIGALEGTRVAESDDRGARLGRANSRFGCSSKSRTGLRRGFR
jgi:hypothetical protein